MRASSVSWVLVLCAFSIGCDSNAKPGDAGAADASGGDTAPPDVVLPEAAVSDVATADASTDAAGPDTAATDAQAGATVVGALTLPGSAAGKPWFVRIISDLGAATGPPLAEATGFTTGSAQLEYSIANVPAGTYYVLGFVDVDGSGGTASTPGDYAGWYGHTGDGNPPPAKNAVVPASGMVRFDFSLVLR